jgi:hypothetical protein
VIAQQGAHKCGVANVCAILRSMKNQMDFDNEISTHTDADENNFEIVPTCSHLQVPEHHCAPHDSPKYLFT